MATGILGATSLTTEKLLERVQEHFSPEDSVLFKNARAFAEAYYAHITHPIGKPYILYVTEVANKLHDLHADPTLISATMIYPPPSVAIKVLDDLKKAFKDKDELVKLVEEIHRFDRLEWNAWSTSPQQNETKEDRERREILQKMFFLAIDENNSDVEKHISPAALHFQKREKQRENLIRMFLAATSDVRALIFKLVDRLHFTKSLKDLPHPQQEAIHLLHHAKITLAIYAPLADRLGLWRIKSELEDMSFRLLQPDEYKVIAKQLDSKKELRKKDIDDIIPVIRAQIEASGIKVEISGRAKHIYSIYQKMEAKQLDIEEINDLLGIRIIVEADEDCYKVQGILHACWLPITTDYGGKAGRDWIARPKENAYQSLHTTLGIAGKIVEVQIRTRAMHEVAEYGAASAHWRYKENKSYRKGKMPRVTKPKDQVWSEQLAELRKSLENELPSSTQTRSPFLKNQIFVITPEGHVIDLTAGATPLDFAYRIHTDLGNRYTGAKVGDHLVQLDYQLKNGDIVELITSRARKGPSPDWLSRSKDNEGNTIYVFARTRQARGKIRHWFKEHKNTTQS